MRKIKKITRKRTAMRAYIIAQSTTAPESNLPTKQSDEGCRVDLSHKIVYNVYIDPFIGDQYGN